LVVNPNKKSRMQQQPNQTPAMAAAKEAKEEADIEEIFGDRGSKPVKPLSNPQVGIGGKPEELPRNPTWAVI
jgi:hypothetical protein